MEAKAQAAESSIETSGTKEDALKSAISAAELYMKATSTATSDHDKARLRAKCKQLLSRAEEIKKAKAWIPVKKDLILKAPVSHRAISRKEEVILLESSKLHGFIFPPWTTDPQNSIFEESFNGSPYYTEPADLKLSECQIDIFDGWKRPHELFPSEGRDLDMMLIENDIDLVQDITTDCSVVASLCAGTARAIKGHGKLLASLIYPYDRSKVQPHISKNGKYIFRFHFNGCFRKVVIDDRLPSSNTTRSLHVVDRNNPHLLWPALVEKAYLKVRGGYDFPGSNSGTDLWVLTGWIPEQVFLQSDDLQPNQLWSRIHKSFSYGDIMVTLGTGKLSNKEEKALGLAGEHDYAILDMKEVNSQRLLLVKNPWCDGMVWKGSHFSPAPNPQSWTEELSDALPSETQSLSPGTFWMTFEDVAQHFESLYLNWNPGLFTHRQDHHFSWPIPPIQSASSLIHNPQYSFSSSTPTNTSTPVWILLSRHFATGEDAIVREPRSQSSPSSSSALGFISLYIFAASGQRVYLSESSLHRGAFVDSPQTLATIDLPPSSTPYTVVVAQHGLPLPKYSFTLSFFSRSSLSIAPATDRLSHCSTHSSSWGIRTAGGNASASSYPLNPQYALTVPSTTDLTLILETDQQELAVHVAAVWASGSRVSAVTSRDIVGSSGDYRRGCALASLSNVQAGTYTVVCSTFESGQMGNFTLRVGSGVQCAVRPIPAESAGRMSLRLPTLVFSDGVDRMLAPLTPSRLTKLRVIARCPPSPSSSPPHQLQTTRSRPSLKLTLSLGLGPHKAILSVSNDDEFSDSPMGVRTADVDISPEISARGGGVWIVCERLGGSGRDVVEVEVLSEGGVSVGLWGTGDG